jgi:hypothetical protein
VLPGPEEASPPIKQKYTTIERNHTANPNFQNFATFPLSALFFFIVITQRPKCFIISAIWQHCFCQGGMDFVKSNSCPTLHATTNLCMFEHFNFFMSDPKQTYKKCLTKQQSF